MSRPAVKLVKCPRAWVWIRFTFSFTRNDYLPGSRVAGLSTYNNTRMNTYLFFSFLLFSILVFSNVANLFVVFLFSLWGGEMEFRNPWTQVINCVVGWFLGVLRFWVMGLVGFCEVLRCWVW